MKSAYIKPETEIFFAQLNAAIAITSSERGGRSGDEGEETPPKGSDNEPVGANNGFFSYEDDSHYDAWSNW